MRIRIATEAPVSRGGDEAARPGAAEPPGEVSGPPVAGAGVKVVRLRRDDTCVSCSITWQPATWPRGTAMSGCSAAWSAPAAHRRRSRHRLRPRRAEESEGRGTPSWQRAGRHGTPGEASADRRPHRGVHRAGTPRPGRVSELPAVTQAVVAVIDALAPEHLLALHDRCSRDGDGRLTKATIDDIAVAATGSQSSTRRRARDSWRCAARVACQPSSGAGLSCAGAIGRAWCWGWRRR